MPILRNASLIGMVVLIACCSGRSPEPIESRSGRLGAAPIIGAETRLDEPAYSEQSGEQTKPFIAPGGPGALVVWCEDSSPGFGSSHRPVTFARLDAEGNMLDPLPTTIAPPTTKVSSFPPVAGWNGDRALVVWANNGWEVRGSRLTKEGEVLDPGTVDDPGGIAIALGETRRNTVAVVPFESDFLVYWREGGEPRMGRVGRDGSVAALGGTPIAFPADGIPRVLYGAVPITGGILVMVTENEQTKVMKVDATGAALSALSEAAGPASTLQSAIASSGNGALVCWTQGSTTTTGKPVTIYGRHVSADGAWADAAFEVRAAGTEVKQVGAVWNGSGYLCTWTDAGTRVRANMREIPASGPPVAAAVGPLALTTSPINSFQFAWTGSRYLAAMERTVYAAINGSGALDRPDGVLVRALSADLKPMGTDAVVVSTQPAQQGSFRAVGNPAAAYVVWQDDRFRNDVNANDNTNSDVFGSRVSVSNGGIVKTPALLLTGADIEGGAGVGWDGTQFMAAYFSMDSGRNYSEYLQHVSPLGALAGNRIILKRSYAVGTPVLLWNGQNFLVAALSTSSVSLYRISAAGVPLEAAPISVAANVGITNLLGVALGSTYLLVFQTMPTDSKGASNGQDDLMGLAVNADGTLLTPTPVTIASGVGAQEMPALASDGTSAFVLWRDRGAAGTAIAGTRIDATCARLDGADAVLAQATAPDSLGPPALAWTGNQYVAVWPAAAGATMSFVACSLGGGGPCSPGSETTVATDLPSALPDAGVAGKGDTDNIRAPALVWTESGGVLFYRRLDRTKDVNRERIFVRPMGAGSPPPDGGVLDAAVARPDARSGLAGAEAGGAGGAGGQATGDAGGRAAGGTGGGAGGVATSGIDAAPVGVADAGGAGGGQSGGGIAGQTTDTTGNPVTSNDAGPSLGDAGVPTSTGDGAAGVAAVDAAKPKAASGGGCKCTMGVPSRSALPWSFLLLSLPFILNRRRRQHRTTAARKANRARQTGSADWG